MRFLVTGATGFIGARIVDALLARNHEVVAISSNPQKRIVERLYWLRADLLNSTATQRAIEAAAAYGLVHCAWDTTPGAYWTSSSNLDWTAASLSLLNTFKACGGRRIVVVGTSAEYGWRNSAALVENQSPLAPSSLYGICKNSVREILESWAASEKLSWAWGRVFCPFGPEEKPQRLIPRLITRLLTEDRLAFDSGKLIRDFMSVVDLGDAFAALADSTVVGPINIASGRDMSIRELVTQIAVNLGALPKVQFDALPDPVAEPARIVADISRLNNELGWSPQRSLEQRLAETCDWWRAHIEPAK